MRLWTLHLFAHVLHAYTQTFPTIDTRIYIYITQCFRTIHAYISKILSLCNLSSVRYNILYICCAYVQKHFSCQPRAPAIVSRSHPLHLYTTKEFFPCGTYLYRLQNLSAYISNSFLCLPRASTYIIKFCTYTESLYIKPIRACASRLYTSQHLRLRCESIYQNYLRPTKHFHVRYQMLHLCCAPYV